MAKNDFDLGPEFDDFSSEFDELNFDDPTSTNTKSSRDPITQAKQGLTSGLTSAGKSIGPKLASKIDQNIPNVGSLVSEGMQFASGVQATAQKFSRDVNPSILQLKRSARIIAPKVTKYLPDKVAKKIDDILKTEQSVSSKVSAEAARKAQIDESLALIFAAQEKRAQTTYIEDRAERMLDKTTDKIRHEDLTKLVDSIRISTEFQKNFTSTVGIGYLKKSLELKYQHLFVAKDTLSTVQGMAKVLETKLEQIRHNSALPDIQKQHLSESYKDVMRQSVSQRLNQHLSGWGGRILKNIQSKILDPVVQGLDMAAGGADMYASMSEAMDDFGPQETAAQKVGGFAGGIASGRLAAWLSKKAFGDGTNQGILSPYGRSIGDIAAQTKLRLLLKSKELQDNADPGSLTGFLADILSPGIARGGGTISNDMLNPTDAVPFDRSVRQSIVEVIPGYLAKSVQLLTKLATGEDAEELTYDHTKRDFVGVSSFRNRVVTEAFGDAVSRGRQMGELVGTYRGVTAAAGKDVAKFDEMSQDIATVLTHHALKKYLLNPKVLQKYVEGDELSDNEQSYISRVFEGIENRRAVATAMVAPLISVDGKVDLVAEERINRVIIAIMGSDSYLDTLPKYLHGLGQSRHLSDLFEADGAGFTFNQKRIREILFGGSRDEYASTVTDTTNRIKRFLDQDADEKSATPEFVRKLFKPIFGDPTEREKAPDVTTDGLTPAASAAIAVIANEMEKRSQSATSYDVTRATGGQYTLGSNLPAIISEGYRGPRYTTLLDSADTRFSDRNADIIDAEIYESSKGTTGTSSGLEGIFKEHADRQHPVPDLLQKILNSIETNTSHLGEINDKVLSMLAEIGDGFFGKLTHRGKDFGKSQLDKLMRLKTKAQAKLKDAAEDMYLRALYGKDKIRDKGEELYLRMLYGKDYLLGNQTAGTSGVLGRLAGGVVGAGGTLAGAGAAMIGKGIGKYQDFRNSWDKKKEDLAKKYRGKYKRGLVKGRQFGRKVKAAANLNFRYVDIYLKDKVEPGKPLLTKKKQIEGTVFSNGKKVQSSYDIKLPVLDPITGDTLITEEDIQIGLVDIENRSLTTGLSAINLLKRGFGATFGGLTKLKDLFSSSNPLAKLVGSAGTAFFDLIGAGGKFGFKALSKMFGLDDTSINKEALQSVVGDKLDAILEFLKSRFGDGNTPPSTPQPKTASPVSSDITAGDRDGDGKRDTIFEELVAKNEEKKEAKVQAAQMSMADSLKKLVDYSAKQLDTAKNSLKVQKEAADEAGGGIIDKILGFLGLRSAAGGLGTMAKGAGGALLAKVGLGGLFGGGATAAATAGVATTGAATAATGAAAATGGIGAAMSGMGGVLAASLASNPVGWAVGGTILAAGAAYAGYKWLNPSGDLGIETRAKIYGVKLDESTGMFSESMTAKVISLEEEADAILNGKSAPLNDNAIRNWAGRFGFDVKNVEEIRYWATWYRQRFIPAFRIYISLVKQAGYTYSNVDDIPEESVAAIEKVFLDRVGPHVQQYKDLTPDKNGYTKYQRAYKKLREESEKPGGVSLNEDERDAAQTGRNSQADTTRYSSKYSSTADRAAAAARMSNGDYDTPTGKEKQQQAKSPSFWEKTKSFFGFGQGGSGGQNVEPIDTSGYNPPPPDSNELGALSAKFESAKLGSLAIGFDGTGGTSYGKYQIATRTGTFNRFLKFAASAGGDGMEVAKRLQSAGDPDTGGKNGSVPNEWKKLVMEGKMGDLEHKFIQATHYDPAFGGLNPELRSMVEKSKALQDVLWSTAVQHGPAGAKSIFNAAFAQAGNAPTPDQIIKLVYGHRGNKFPSSTAAIQASVKGRFRTEAAMALAMLAKEKTTPGDENPEQPPASGTKYEVPATEGTPKSTVTQQKAPGIDTARDSTANAPQTAVATANTGTGGLPASPISSTPEVTTSSSSSTASTGSTDSGGVAELKQLNASMSQLLKSIDALVAGQNVLSEIRDGINSGFANVGGMSSGSSDPVKSAAATQSASSSATPTSAGPGAPAIPMRRASRRNV